MSTKFASYKFITVAVLTAALAAAPVTSAHAEGWHHGGWGHEGWGHEGWHHHDHDFGLIGGLALGVGAIVGAAATVATAPVRVIADAAAPPEPVYAPAPVAYYGGYPPAYYPQRRVVVYSYPQPYPVAYPTYAYPQ